MKLNRILQVPRDVAVRVEAKMKESGYIMDSIYRASNSPSDGYLYYVIGHRPNGLYSLDGFACWMYNDSMNSLLNGHYNISDGRALQIVASNLYLVEMGC